MPPRQHETFDPEHGEMVVHEETPMGKDFGMRQKITRRPATPEEIAHFGGTTVVADESFEGLQEEVSPQ